VELFEAKQFLRIRGERVFQEPPLFSTVILREGIWTSDADSNRVCAGIFIMTNQAEYLAAGHSEESAEVQRSEPLTSRSKEEDLQAQLRQLHVRADRSNAELIARAHRSRFAR
jgi:hypothetical protein